MFFAIENDWIDFLNLKSNTTIIFIVLYNGIYATSIKNRIYVQREGQKLHLLLTAGAFLV